jgi:hypothetical protein
MIKSDCNKITMDQLVTLNIHSRKMTAGFHKCVPYIRPIIYLFITADFAFPSCEETTTVRQTLKTVHTHTLYAKTKKSSIPKREQNGSL